MELKRNKKYGLDIAITLNHSYFKKDDIQKAASFFDLQAGNMLTDFIETGQCQNQEELILNYPEFYLPIECRRMLYTILEKIATITDLKIVNIVTNDLFIVQASEGMVMNVIEDKYTEAIMMLCKARVLY